jgi:hemerythrin
MIAMHNAVKYLVGDIETDSEHLELITLINLIGQYQKDKGLKSLVAPLIVVFSSKLMSHCRAEISILRDANCLYVAEHEVAHITLLNSTIHALEQNIKDNADSIIAQFESDLKDHIRDFDVPAFRSLNELQA